jgi:N6-L-threonylcarbamoyladenine synthase
MIILGIETSCDETALALIETRPPAGKSAASDSSASQGLECRVIQSLVHSQAELHSAYGGVFPTLAKREHGKNLAPLLEKVLKDIPLRGVLTDEKFKAVIESFRNELKHANPDLFESIVHADFLKNIPAIDRIAVTEGPGLEPALWVGINFARVLGVLWDIPIIPINHMEGHVVGSLLESDTPRGAWQKLKTLPLPSIALLISGGHTELVKIETGHSTNSLRQLADLTPFSYTIIGQTKDDAIGEAFDKAARLLGLPYPGGPHIARLAHEAYEQGIAAPVKLPRPMLKSGDLNFSFSGLKTAVLYAVRDAEKAGIIGENAKDPVKTDAFKKGLAHEFEQAVADVLETKLRMAIDKTAAKSIIIGGGVAANHVLRERLEKVAEEYGIPIFMPSRHISGDNALMIALAGTINDNSNKNEKSPALGRELRADGTKRLGQSN